MHARLALVFALFAVGCGSSVDETGGTTETDTGTVSDGSSGDSTSTTETGGGTDTGSGTDSTTATDTGSTTDDGGTVDATGIMCGSSVCAADEVCCASPSGMSVAFTCSKTGCPDGGATIACDGPEDCSGGKICCAEAEVTGSGFMCGFKAAAADCRATCNTMIPTGCPGKATIRPCHAAADCAESGYKNCCTFSGGGSSATFCAPDLIKSFASKCY